MIFVAFTGEESGLLGSKRFASAPSPWPASQAIGMVNLDTVGRLSGGRILVLGSSSASEWIHIVNGAGYVTGAPVEAVMTDPGGSDQKSFIEIGVPAVQLFTGANADYHKPGDTADKIDGPGLVKVAAVTRELVAYLAERPTPLSSNLSGAAVPAAAASAAHPWPIPDYAFLARGAVRDPRLAGGQERRYPGDVIVKLRRSHDRSMRDFSDDVEDVHPGARVVGHQRDGKATTVEATLVAR